MTKKEDEKAEHKKSSSTVRIKYVGQDDERTLLADDTFGGRLPDGLGVDLFWSGTDNDHLVEVKGLDREVLDLILSQRERDGSGGFINAFVDVTGMKVVPEGEWAKRWRPNGLPDARSRSAIQETTGGAATSGLGEVADVGASDVGGST